MGCTTQIISPQAYDDKINALLSLTYLLGGRMNTPDTTPRSSEIRKRGLKMLAGGGVVFAAILCLMYWLSAHGYKFHFAVIGASIPFVFVCVGFIELVTGSPYQRLAQSWMALAAWQRGVLGTFIVVAALGVILCVVTFFVMLFT